MCINARFSVILTAVMKMKNSKDMLSSILKTTQMGQLGIRSVLNASIQPDLRKELESQLQEYNSIEREAHAIAASRGWELQELNPAVKGMTNMMTHSRLSYGDVSSKAAAMMISGNTRGMIKSLKNIHRFAQKDAQISTLSQRLLDCETANIRQVQGFV